MSISWISIAQKIWVAPKWFIRYSGLEFIFRKFHPSDKPKTLPTGFIWVLGVYIAFFGVMSQRYENRLDRLENRRNAVLTLMLNKDSRKTAISQVADIQNKMLPFSPGLWPPHTVKSLFSRYNQPHDETRQILIDAIASIKNDLQNVNLTYAYLEGADLRDANLEGANLEGANLKVKRFTLKRRAGLDQKRFLKTNLRGAMLKKVKFRYTNLKGADLTGANLEGAFISHSDLSEQWLSKAETGEYLPKMLYPEVTALVQVPKEGYSIRTVLYKVNLTGAALIHVNLNGANLIAATLNQAVLLDVNLKGANLNAAVLDGAWLMGTNLKDVKGLEFEQLSKVSTLHNVKNLDPELEKKLRDNGFGHLLDKKPDVPPNHELHRRTMAEQLKIFGIVKDK